ncbi:MAG: T9SS type A sorting domain-containing protein [Bacteroidetes bacterium]|nr:T9SS type A sorting domain-containing protein [Bacteroidota bacterium]
MMRFSIVMLLLACTLGANAQTGGSKVFKTPLSGTAVLRDIQDKYIAHVQSLEAPEVDGEGEREELEALKEKIGRLFPHCTDANRRSTQAKLSAVATPIIVQSFVPDSNSGIPPDNSYAISRSGVGMNAMNSRVSVINAITGQIVNVKSLNSFTSPVGLNDPNDYRYDPKLIYDPEADRFIAVCLSGVNQYNHIIVGFSKSADPTSGWNFYKFYGDYGGDSTWFDYPIISITNNELFLTGNKLVYDGSFQLGFVRSVIYQIRKADGYNGDTLTSKIWDSVNYGGRPIRNIFPVNGGSSIQGPAQYFLSVRNMDVQNDSVFIMKIGDTIGSAGNTLTVAAYKSNLSYGFPPDGRQMNTPKKLQTNDGRVLGAFAEGSEIQFACTSVQPGSGADAIYHGRIANYKSSPVVTADFITDDTLDYAYPNLSYAGQVGGKNASIISFDYSGPTTFAGLGAVMWDGAGYSPLLKVKEGANFLFQSSSSNVRWGDYSGTQPVYGKPGNVWITGIYGKDNTRYGIWTAQLQSPFIVGVPGIKATNVPTKLYPNPAVHFIRLDFNLKEAARVSFRLFDLNGRLVDEVLNSNCKAGANELVFNTASLASGSYFLKGFSPDGYQVMLQQFVKQ